VACKSLSSDVHGYVLGENVYQDGIVNLKLRLESLKNNKWMFVGVIKEDAIQVSPANNASCGWFGSHGWVLGSDGGRVWQNGLCRINNTLKNRSKQGDMVELVLDCDAGKLSLHLPTGHQFQLEIPKSKTWRLNVTLLNASDKIRIVDD
jgi:hypothetical protein